MAREVRVERLTVMMRRFHVVEVHVHQRRGNRARLHENDEDGGRQPATHRGIVATNHVRRT